MAELKIIYRDDYLIAIDKPAGLLVHHSELTPESENAVKSLRKQINRKVYPVHRLDRATSGVLLFALDYESQVLISRAFEDKKVLKTYYAVVRGYTKEHEVIDYALRKEDTEIFQDAVSEYFLEDKTELDYSVGRYATARYSLVRINPLTGRRHQIRKHFHHIFHPVIGDTTYGDTKHNHFFRDRLGIPRLMLVASALQFTHPHNGQQVKIETTLPEEFAMVFNKQVSPFGASGT